MTKAEKDKRELEMKEMDDEERKKFEEDMTDDTKDFYRVRIHAYCNKNKDKKKKLSEAIDKVDECTSAYQFTDPQACPTDWDITKAAKDVYHWISMFF